MATVRRRSAVLMGAVALIAASGVTLAAGVGGSDTAAAAAASPTAVEPVFTESKDAPLQDPRLSAANVVGLRAQLSPAESQALLDGAGVTFTAVVDGESQEITTAADTFADALAEAGIELGWQDEVAIDLSDAPVAGAEVRIGRASTQIVTEEVLTPHETTQRSTSALLEGTTRVVQEGVDGVAQVTHRVRLVGQEEVARTPLVSVLVSEPVTEIVEVGTRKPEPVATPAPSGSSGGSNGSGSSGGSGPSVPTGSASASTAGNRALGQQLMLSHGFAADQWSCLESLWTKESNWNHTLKNPSSSAFGIPQAMMSVHFGSDWTSPGNARAQEFINDPAVQIRWGLNYIQGRYGSPCAAWGHFQQKNWY